MKEENLEQERKTVLPRWLVILLIMATAGITAAAFLATTGLRGPVVAWDGVNKRGSGVWPGELAGAAAQATAGPTTPPVMAQPAVAQAVPAPPVPVQPIVAQPVALSGAPAIVWGTPIGHGDRGPCTNCHALVSPRGSPLPTISALSEMPHEFRGVCNNCHQIKVSWLLGLLPVAAMPNMARQPTEAEWRGLEVKPSPQGVVINGIEGAAKRAGLRKGDVITSINAMPTRTMADFVRATENGNLIQGAVIAGRDGQRLAFEVGPRTAAEAQPLSPQPLQAPAPAVPPKAPF